MSTRETTSLTQERPWQRFRAKLLQLGYGVGALDDAGLDALAQEEAR